MNTPIQNDQEYQAALERLERIFDAVPGSAESIELEELSKLIEAYENFHFPIDLPEEN